jgi:hypothetical protein
MLDDNNESSGFKVVDRRPFSVDGTPRDAADEKEKNDRATAVPSGPSALSPESPVTPLQSSPLEDDSQDDSLIGGPDSEEMMDEGLSGFATLVSYLSTTAMFQLGLLPGPAGERIPMDLPNARRTVDLLEVLQEKTQGNLTADESKMLDDVLYELRLTYVEVQKRATQTSK